MIFTKSFFWGFFLVVLIIFSFIYKRKTLRNVYLFLVSLFFYYKTGGLFLFILIFSTITDFYLGKAIFYSRGELKKKLLLAFSLCLNLSVLVFFKYDYFFTETFNNLAGTQFEVVTHGAKWSNMLLGTHFSIDRILPPVGISFFTFQSISYVVEVYRSRLKPVEKITDYGFYISFFPQLVAGPIVRASEFIPQLYKPFELSQKAFGLAVFMILKGLFKKIFIGDYIAVNLIDRVFANPGSYTGFENLMGLYGYSLQVYCDFSGYTDIAIGLALLMGFRLPVNFNSPYKAQDVGDFWKRWHMSLSSWLRDYLYIPMGGNRNGSVFTYISLISILAFLVLLAGKLWLIFVLSGIVVISAILMQLFPKLKLQVTTNINLMVTMLLGGLWHGASWMFMIWGGLNGLGLVFYKYWKKISPFRNMNNRAVKLWGIFITFNFITFTRIWFRGESMKGTFDLLRQITSNFGWAEIPAMVFFYVKVFIIMLLGYVLHWLPSSLKEKGVNWFVNTPVYFKIGLSALVIFIIYQSVSSVMQPFIYFQF
jgi:alginate O-acetyltransferase complex protein AlgI